MNPKRIARLYQILQSNGLAGLALVPGANLRYLSGLTFHLMERPILGLFADTQPPRLVLPDLERAKVEASGFEAELYGYGEVQGDAVNAFRSMAEQAGIDGARIGVEATTMRVLEMELLQAAAPTASISSADAALSGLRISRSERRQQG